MPYVSEEMETARVTAGLTRRELAVEVGRSESHIRNVENGDKPISDVYLSRIVRAVNKRLDFEQRVTFAELLADPSDQPRTKRPAEAGAPA